MPFFLVDWGGWGMRVLRLSASAVAVLIAASSVSFAGPETDPAVSPDRIDDVADGPGDPFPRFDNFSWRAFIALNWPASTDPNHRGEPDRTKKLGDPGLRVWETYKARYEVFAPGSPIPAKWESYNGVNPCGENVSNLDKTLSAFSHFADYNQAAASLKDLANPLVAQNKTYTRYEVRFNREQYQSIFDNKWYAKLPTEQNPGRFNTGSIEIKAAWRILNNSDSPAVRARYYVTKALVFDPDATTKQGKVVCTPQDIALTGFHIVIKTKLRPQWIWSSFEHVDNVPPKTTEPDAANVPAPYSYNSGMPPQQLDPKKAPTAISVTNPPESNPKPMQVVRLLPIRKETMKRNLDYWNLPEVRGTVWANYMLVMTQWPTTTAPEKPSNDGGPFPNDTSATLANTTMETYQQKNSCIGCHQEVSNSKGRDFVAFMSFDLLDPQKLALARALPPVAGAGANVMAAPAGAPPAPQRTALDDDPGIQALVRILQKDQ
jgi:hypothetical protein